MIKALPDMEDIDNAKTRVDTLQRIPDMRTFHASNIEEKELVLLLQNCTGLIFTGQAKIKIIERIKAMKPSKKIVAPDEEDFI